MLRIFRTDRFSGLLFSGLFLILVFSFLLPLPVAQASGIILSEVQTEGSDENDKTVLEDEFIELYNSGSTDAPLTGLKLCKKTSTGGFQQLKSFTSSADIIGAGKFFLFAHAASKYAKAERFANASTGSFPLANDNSIGLVDSCKNTEPPTVVIDSLRWGKGKPFDDNTYSAEDNIPRGQSLTRDLATLKWLSAENPTPTNHEGIVFGQSKKEEKEEESSPSLPPPEVPQTFSIRLNEIFINPKAKGDEGEFIEIYNFSNTSVSLRNWKIKISNWPDNDKAEREQKITMKPDESLEPIIEAGEYFVLEDGKNLTIPIANSNKMLELFNEAGILVDSMRYESAKEGVSLNRSGDHWRGSKHLTPGAPNILNNAPETREKVPKKAYVDVSSEFNARGEDADKEHLKFRWDFGDGHKSFKEKTTHKYKKKGAYVVTLKTSDGNEDTIETFTVQVQSFPEHDLRIKALLPNPTGKDEDGEWILIENKEKKEVNLRGYSIATGSNSDKLTNHPVRDDFILEKKSEAKVTRAAALFTLPNKKGRVELRGPDGQVIDKAKYKLDKAAENDMMYFKEKGREWAWKAAEQAPSGERFAANPRTIREPQEITVPPEALALSESSSRVPENETSAIQEAPWGREEAPEETAYIIEGPLLSEKKSVNLLTYGMTRQLPSDFLAVSKERKASPSFTFSLESEPNEKTGHLLTDLNAYFNALLNETR